MPRSARRCWRPRPARCLCSTGARWTLLAIKERTERLRRAAHYRSDGDTVPTNDSVHAPLGATYNVLAEDGFDLQRILLR